MKTDFTNRIKMKQTLILAILFWAGLTFAQQTTGYEVHTCKSGHCAVISFPDAMTTQLKSGTGEWCEPIRISVGVQEGLSITNGTIQAAIAEDSDIAISEGMYTGSGSAYELTHIFNFSPSELTDEGLPFIINSVSAAFSTLNFNGNVGTIYDSQVLTSRECYGSQMMYVIVDNATSGAPELATNGISPDSDRNPTVVFKQNAFSVSTRNHGISHAAGENHPNHEDGPEPTRRPLQVGNDLSYGWSTTGLGGFSGGTALGIGPNGEDLAGHISDGYVSWLGLIPKLTAEIVSIPAELDIDEDGNFEASINKDIGNENWEWTFINNGNTVNESGSNVVRSFSQAGTWTYEVIVSNDCGGQSDSLSGTFMVNQTTSIIDVNEDQRISVYPNPTSNFINIELDHSISVKEIVLFDQSGKIIKKETSSNKLSLAELPNGQYHIKVVTSNEIFSTKIVKTQ